MQRFNEGERVGGGGGVWKEKKKKKKNKKEGENKKINSPQKLSLCPNKE